MEKLRIRRAIDVAFGVVALAVCAPPIVAMATIARLKSKQSGIFRQTRYGLHGKPFTIYKIRTLDDDLNPLPISGIFRKLGIDEMPQIINVLKGDMSIIGPRPQNNIPEIPEWKRVLDVAPGLTGLSGVAEKLQGYENTPEQRAKIEGEYVDRRLSSRSSLPLDMLIIFKAALIIFTGRADAGKSPSASVPPGHASPRAARSRDKGLD